MIDTIVRWLNMVPDVAERKGLWAILQSIGDRFSSQCLTSAGLAIKTGGSALAKTGSAAIAYIANGVLQTIAGSTDMPALSGSITATKYNVFCFFADSAGVVTSAMGTEGAAAANVVFPPLPQGKAMIGFLLITYASTFVGGSTALDTATTIYVNTVGAFDPTVLPGSQ